MSNTKSLVGLQLDEYRLENLLGEGGMASVYRAIDVRLNRYVAIKVIQAGFRTDSSYTDRFKREAQAIAQLEHPNIITLYRFGDKDGLLYLAMQYIDGADLAAVIQSFRRDHVYIEFPEIIQLAHEIGAALDYAHSRGVIHRDIKPHNIMINNDGRAIVTDFGLALLTELGTRGETFGSPHYIAPEQAISSAGAVPQSDLYAFAIVLYEMLTNVVPFDANEPLDIAMMHMSEPVPSPRNYRPDLPEAVAQVIIKALSKAPADRYATGKELASAFEAAFDKKPPISKASVSVAERVALEIDANPLPPLPAEVAPPKSQAPTLTHPDAPPKPQAAPPEVTLPNVANASATTLVSARRWPLPAPVIGGGVLILIVIVLLMLNSGRDQVSPEATRIARMTDAPTVVLSATPEPVNTATQSPRSDQPLRMLTNGENLVTGEQITNGEMVPLGYCERLSASYATVNEGNDWYCVENGERVQTLVEEDFTAVCRMTYDDPTATAIRLAGADPDVVQWRCFGQS